MILNWTGGLSHNRGHNRSSAGVGRAQEAGL